VDTAWRLAKSGPVWRTALRLLFWRSTMYLYISLRMRGEKEGKKNQRTNEGERKTNATQ